MLSYIASNSIKDLITKVCEELSITILSHIEQVDFLKYIKETKVNFNLVKYIIINVNDLENTEEEKINSICYFKELYPNTKIIIIAKGYNEQNLMLTTLYEKEIYNIINTNEIEQIRIELKKCLTLGLNEKDSKRFKKITEEKIKKSQKYKEKLKQLQLKIITVKEKVRTKTENKKSNISEKTQNNSVYFFAILLEAVTRLVKLICYIAVFLLTSVGLTFLFNEELRNIVFQIFRY